MHNRTLALAFIVLIAVAIVIPASAQDAHVTEISDVDLPIDAIQLLANTNFDGGGGCNPCYQLCVVEPWILHGNSYVDFDADYPGGCRLWQGGVTGVGTAMQKFDVSECRSGPVWIRAAYNIEVSWDVWPPNTDGDQSYAWIENEDGEAIVKVWHRYDHDYTFEWVDQWYIVNNLTDDCESGCMLYIRSEMRNEPGDYGIHYYNLENTTFSYDDIEVWCLPHSHEMPYRTLFPYVPSGHTGG